MSPNIFVPCARDGARRYIMATPLQAMTRPAFRIMAFSTPAEGIAAFSATADDDWTLVTPAAELVMPRIERPDGCGMPTVWETDPVDLALSGVAGVLGFGIDLCAFDAEQYAIRIVESLDIQLEEFDVASMRARLEIELD